MKAAFIFLLCISVNWCYAQNKKDKIFLGQLNQKTFTTNKQLRKWFFAEYNSYKVNDTLLQRLTTNFSDDKRIVVVLGTWCSDSQREFPRLIKILEAIHYPVNTLSIFALSRDKKLPSKIVHQYKITNVPTIIVMNDWIEFGRIVEEPKVS